MKNPIDTKQMQLWFLGTFGIIISAMKIPFRNPSFITFTLITSIPLFFITLVPRLFHLHDQLSLSFIEALHTLKILTVTCRSFSAIKTVRAVEVEPPIPKVYIDDLINFLTALATICASSTIHTTSDGDHKASMGLRHLLRNTITRSLGRNGVFTFIAMSMLHNICLPYVAYCIHVQQLHLSSFTDSLIFKSVHVMVPAVTFAIWVEYNAWWKLSVVASIVELEEQRGLFRAFSTSSQLMKGNKLQGFVLMLLPWSLDWPPTRAQNSNLPIFRGQSLFECTNFAHAFLQASLLCLGKVMTWMVFTVYYFDCKNRQQKRLSFAL